MDMNLVMGVDEFVAGALLFAIALLGSYMGHKLIRPYMISCIKKMGGEGNYTEDNVFMFVVSATLGVSIILLLLNINLLFIS